MLTLAQVLQTLEEGDWLVSLDLQEAYFHIPIFQSHRKYLRFCIGGQHYQFKVFPFGITTVPRVFTKVLAVVEAQLRRYGIPVFPYLDDWLIKARSPLLVSHCLQRTCHLLHELGFSLNIPKSHLIPSQRLQYIGAILVTSITKAFPLPQRVQDILDMIPMFQPGARVQVRKVLRLLVLMAS